MSDACMDKWTLDTLRETHATYGDNKALDAMGELVREHFEQTVYDGLRWAIDRIGELEQDRNTLLDHKEWLESVLVRVAREEMTCRDDSTSELPQHDIGQCERCDLLREAGL